MTEGPKTGQPQEPQFEFDRGKFKQKLIALMQNKERFENPGPLIKMLKGIVAAYERLPENIKKWEKEGLTQGKEAEIADMIKEAAELKPIYEALVTYFESLQQELKKQYVYKGGDRIIKDSYIMIRAESLKPKHDSGQRQTEEGVIEHIWETEQGQYIQRVLPEFAILPGFKAPIVTADLLRHICSLICMQHKHNKKRAKQGLPPEAKAIFTLKQYGQQRAWTDEEIAEGGSRVKRAVDLLYTGATTYFIAHFPKHIVTGHFYELGEPTTRGGEWFIKWGPTYAEAILNSGAYIPIYEAVINDRSISDFTMLLFFAILGQVNTSGRLRPGDFIYIKNLLQKAKAPVRILKRDKEAYESFISGITYFNKMSQGGLQAIRFMSKEKKVKVVTDLDKLESWSYEDFTREIMQPLEITKGRELKVAFTGKQYLPETTAEGLPEIPPEKRALPETIL